MGAKKVVYYRVSTKGQGQSGLGLAAQRSIIESYVDPADIEAEFTEVASGKDIDGRPELRKALDLCSEHGYSLAVAKLDRLSRRTEDALEVWRQLDGRLFSCDIPTDNGKMDKFTLTIFMAIADRERELIGIRTRAALQAKKAQGAKLGKPENMTAEAQRRGAERQRESARKAYQRVAATARLLRDQGNSYQSIADWLNENGYETRTGKPFHAMTVKRILDRTKPNDAA